MAALSCKGYNSDINRKLVVSGSTGLHGLTSFPPGVPTGLDDDDQGCGLQFLPQGHACLGDEGQGRGLAQLSKAGVSQGVYLRFGATLCSLSLIGAYWRDTLLPAVPCRGSPSNQPAVDDLT